MLRLPNRRIRSLPLLLCTLLAAGCASTGTRAPGKAMPGAWSDVIPAMEAGDYARAERKLMAMKKRNGKNASVLANLGVVYARTDRLGDAEDALKQSLEVNKRMPAAWNELGLVYRKTGRFADAEKAYLNALDVEPGYAYARRNLAVLYDLYMQKPGAALVQFAAYRELAPENEQEIEKWIADLSRRAPEAAAAVGKPE